MKISPWHIRAALELYIAAAPRLAGAMGLFLGSAPPPQAERMQLATTGLAKQLSLKFSASIKMILYIPNQCRLRWESSVLHN